MEEPDARQAVGCIVSTAIHELLDSMQVLCNRLQGNASPLGQDQYDRLAVLVPSMLGAAEELCLMAERVLTQVNAESCTETSPVAMPKYAELAQALAESRRLARLIMVLFRPQVPEHQDAIGVIERISRDAKARGLQ